MEFSESDCCGNGCANCVLNFNNLSKHSKDIVLEEELVTKENILNRFSYFCLIRKKAHFVGCNTLIELHYKSLEKAGNFNNDNYILHLKPGQHVMMRIHYHDIVSICNNAEISSIRLEEYVLRPYSPFWWHTKLMELKILVKLQPEGLMSKYLNAAQENCSRIEFRAFPTSYNHNLDIEGISYKMFITQGVAIAAILPIIEHIINNENDMTRIIHLLCFTNLDQIYFRDKLIEFNMYWNYQGLIFLSRQCCESLLCLKLGHCQQDCETFKKQLRYKDAIYPYRLNDDILKNLFNSYMSLDINNNHVVLAGSRNFQNHYQMLLLNCDAEYKIIDKNIFIL